jgi:hypothetical protein
MFIAPSRYFGDRRPAYWNTALTTRHTIEGKTWAMRAVSPRSDGSPTEPLLSENAISSEHCRLGVLERESAGSNSKRVVSKARPVNDW